MAISIGQYFWPLAVQGGAVAPTAAQNSNEVTCSVIASADADVGPFTITHNLGFTAAELAADQPEVVLQPMLTNGAAKLWGVTSKTANAIQITGANVVGSGNAGAQLSVKIRRTHSMVR